MVTPDPVIVPDKSSAPHAMTEFGAAYDAAGISSSDNVYVRIYVANADGTLAEDQSTIRFGTSGAGTWTHKADDDGDYGYVFYGTGLTKAMLQSITAQAAAGSYLYSSSTGRVGIVIAKSPFANLTPADAADVAAITEEPDWDAQYVYKFKSDKPWEGDESGAEVITITNIIDNGVTSVTADLSSGTYKNYIQEKFGSNYMDDFYLRWYLQDADGNPIDLVSDPFTGKITSHSGSLYTDKKGWSWLSDKYNDANSVDKSGYQYWSYFAHIWDYGKYGEFNGADWTNVFQTGISLPAGYTSWADVQVVCAMTNNTADLSYDGSEIASEPAFQLKYVFKYMTAAEAIAAYTPNNEAAETVEKVLEITNTDETNGKKEIDLDDYLTDIASQLSIDFSQVKTKKGGSIPFFLRWYLIDKEGEPVVGSDANDYYNKAYSSTASTLYTAFTNTWAETLKYGFANSIYGKVFYSATKGTTNYMTDSDDSYRHLKFTLPSGADWSDYRVVAIMTTNCDGVGAFDDDNTYGDAVYADPTAMELKYVFRFVKTADLEKLFTASEQAADAIATKAHEGVVVIDNANTTEVTVDFTSTSSFLDWSTAAAFGDAGSNLADNFIWTRFLLTDQDGKLIDVADKNFSISLVNTASGNNVLVQNKGNDGLVVCTPSWGFSTDLLKVKVTGPAGTDWTKVRVVMLTATDKTGYDQVGNVIVHEPNNIFSAWNTIILTDKEGLFLERPAANQRTIYQKIESPAASTFTVNLNEWANKIAHDLARKDKVSELENLYLRAYVQLDGELLPATTANYTITGQDGHVSQKYGLIWYNGTSGTSLSGTTWSKLANSPADVLNPTVTLQGGRKQTDVSIVFMLTDDLSGIIDRSALGLTVGSDPENMKWQYTLEFITEDDAAAMTKAEYDTKNNPTATETQRDRAKVNDETATVNLGTHQSDKTPLNLSTLLDKTTLSGGIKYLRIYLADASGKPVSVPTGVLTSTSTDAQDKGEKGLAWVSQTGIDASAVKAIFETVTLDKSKLPAGTTWDDVQAVCVLSDELKDADGGYLLTDQQGQGTVIFEEPATLDAKLTLEFKNVLDDYSSDVVNAEYEETIQHEHKTYTPVSLDITSNHAGKYISSEGPTSKENLYTDLQQVFTDAGTALGEGNFYIRWYLTDSDGDMVVPIPDGITITPNTGNGQWRDMTSKKGYNIGKIWYTGFGSDYTYSDALLKATVSVSEDSGLDLNDYQVRCVMTFVTSDDTKFDASTNTFSSEPDLQVGYTYKFQSDFAGLLNDDAFSHSKEILIPPTTENTQTAVIPLYDALQRIYSEYNTTRADLGRHFHARWYVTYDGQMVANSESYFSGGDQWLKTATGYGVYLNSWTMHDSYGNNPDVFKDNDADLKARMNLTFTNPDLSQYNWEKFKVIVVMSDDTSEENGQVNGYQENWAGEHIDSRDYWVKHEPERLNMVYYYNFFVEGDFVFVHSKGVTDRDYLRHGDYNGPYTDKRVSTTTPAVQYSWENSTSTRADAPTDIRQGVHTAEYDIYIDPAGEQVKLKNPFERFFSAKSELEHYAYVRWYDWATDLNSSHLIKHGTMLIGSNVDTENDNYKREVIKRGWFLLNNSNPSIGAGNSGYENIGVLFNPAGLTEGEPVTIACDVSKYYDGIYTGSQGEYLMHEPTLSVRYMFNVHHAAESAKPIYVSERRLQTALDNINSGSKKYSEVKNDMFDLFDDQGLTVVSIKDSNTEFILRCTAAVPYDYAFYKAGSDTESETPQFVNGKDQVLNWYAYLEDENGLWVKGTNSTSPTAIDRKTASYDYLQGNRIAYLVVDKFNGDYHLLGGNQSKNITASGGQRFHVVGKVVDTDNVEHAVVHYELRFVNAPAYRVTNLPTQRRDEYFMSHLKPAIKSPITFDEYMPNLDRPLTVSENFSETPLPWDYAQYGFCYPQNDKYRIPVDNEYMGLSPLHGDYMLLKSMNVTGISESETNFSDIYKLHWWSTKELWDYTHVYQSTYYDNDELYGTFFYVDASDESRTMTKLPFKASLCGGSELYFTMAIADMCEQKGQLPPQVCAHVWQVDENGTKIGDKPVISFLTCELETAIVSDGGLYKGQWWQIYGHGILPASNDLNGGERSYIVDIDNYSRHTDGADYAIDQIMFYTNTAQVKVEQKDADCDDVNVSTDIFMPADNLEVELTAATAADPVNIYWRICSADGQVLTGPGIYSAEDTEGNLKYGTVSLSSFYQLTSSNELTAASVSMGYKKRNDGNVYIYLADDLDLPLDESKSYYVSIFTVGGNPELADDGEWGSLDNLCTTYSDTFIAQKVNVALPDELGGGSGATIGGGCNSTEEVQTYELTVKIPDQDDPTGFVVLPNVHFDFFINVSKEEYTTKDYATLLNDYRTAYPNYEGLNDAYQSGHAEAYATLKKLVDDGKLLLSKSTGFTPVKASGTYFILADAVEKKKEGHDICSPIAFSLTYLSGGGPVLELGFDDVDYSKAGTKRVIRVGLEQLNKMRQQGYKLHVPVSMYKDKNGETANEVYFPTDSYLVLSETTDPTQTSLRGTAKFAHIVPIDEKETRPSVDKTHMYLSLDLTTDNCAIDFHEGYEYEVNTTFYDKDDEDDEGLLKENACVGELFILIKVVPEFVTWEAQHVDGNGYPTATETDYWSANWYNDGNWHRSTRAELYKDKNEAGKKQNTATKGHPAGYDNNGEGALSSLTAGSNPGFVPMKFTYVTLPTGNNAPSLINEPRVVVEGTKGAKRQGGGFLDLTRTELLTDRSPNANTDGMKKEERHNSRPTENIYYDMLVRYSQKENDKFGEGCFGHRYIKDDGTWADQGEEDLTLKVFDVEKFQGNVCREIYFKPGAELLRPHRLQYEKAWVEMELDANKWYLVSAPLKATYAGDMYVPATSIQDFSFATEKMVTGRQVTEAFQPIRMTDADSKLLSPYSRTKYPVYQRSWGDNHGKVYVKENDARAADYTANLPYAAVGTTMVEWGHTFNDVQVPYNTLKGFSIRAHKKDQTDKTLIRLPKADTSYEYYEWNDASQAPAAGNGIKSVPKPDTDLYRLVSDYQDDTDTDTSPLTFDIADMQQQDDYVLVGNPFMVSLDMNKFFETNPALGTDGYWTYEGSTATAHAIPSKAKTTVIKPLQAFFVKKGTATQIVFNKEMQIDGNFPTPPGWNADVAPAPQVKLTVSDDNGGSSAVVTLSESAEDDCAGNEDVETLFDSNLSDVPVVYTVAGGQAVSVDVRPELSVVPFGVTCAAMAEPVEVTLSGIDAVTAEGRLYVFDAVDGTTTEVADGGSVSIQPNDYGRYFLSATSDLGRMAPAELADAIVVSVRGQQVTVTATKPLVQVSTVTLGGAQVNSLKPAANSCQYQLSKGVYIIDACTDGARQRMKVVVE